MIRLDSCIVKKKPEHKVMITNGIENKGLTHPIKKISKGKRRYITEDNNKRSICFNFLINCNFLLNEYLIKMGM